MTKQAVVILTDDRGRVAVGDMPPEEIPPGALAPARDLEDALERARGLLSGQEQLEEHEFRKGFESQYRDPRMAEPSRSRAASGSRQALRGQREV